MPDLHVDTTIIATGFDDLEDQLEDLMADIEAELSRNLVRVSGPEVRRPTSPGEAVAI